MKPMLASDADLTKIRFPVMVQPKIDGVRGLVINGKLVGRSLKTHRNEHVTKLFSDPLLEGFDGELFYGDDPTHPELCRLTSGALSRIEGEPPITFNVFDWCHPSVIHLDYSWRMQKLWDYMDGLSPAFPLRMAATVMAYTLEELEAHDSMYLERGYEGTIIRDPKGTHKQGRSTVKEGGLLRIKRFTEEEAMVLELVEGNRNENEAKTNELGRTERSSAQAGLVPNGLVGALICRDLKTGQEITVSKGRLNAEEQRYYWMNPSELVGKIIKYKCFPIGVKDKPRFPTFQTIRAESDMS